MSILNQNTADLRTILNAVNDLYSIDTCTVTITVNSGIILQMYSATVITGNTIGTFSDSNMVPRDKNFTVPVVIDNVIVGSGVLIKFSGAILSDVKVEGEATVIDLGADHYLIKPVGNCTITCYDND